MTNTSATGGYLAPVAFGDNDAALRRVIHDFIAGVTGIDGGLVRPKWQKNPAAIPANGTDWCAFDLNNFMAGNAYQVQIADGDDTQLQYQQNEVFDLNCSFYGDNCQRYAGVIRDGLQIAQNREALFLLGVSVSGGVQITRAPELIDDVWFDRCDISVQMGRTVNSDYPVLHFTGADGTIQADTPLSVYWFAGIATPVGIFDATFDETFN